MWIFHAHWNHGWFSWNGCRLVLHLGPWCLSCNSLTLWETVFRVFQNIVFFKLSIRVNQWRICFWNLMSGKYQIFYWLGCLWMLGLCLPVYNAWCLYRNRGNTFFSKVACWLKVFFDISDNICNNYLFQRNIHLKSYYWWYFEYFSITCIDI